MCSFIYLSGGLQTKSHLERASWTMGGQSGGSAGPVVGSVQAQASGLSGRRRALQNRALNDCAGLQKVEKAAGQARLLHASSIKPSGVHAGSTLYLRVTFSSINLTRSSTLAGGILSGCSHRLMKKIRLLPMPKWLYSRRSILAWRSTPGARRFEMSDEKQGVG